MACGMQARHKKTYKVLIKKPEGKRPSEDLGVDERIIRIDLRKIGWKGVDWIHLAQDNDQWRVFVNTVMDLQGP